MGPSVSVWPEPAVASASAFVDAIVWGEHITVWELLSTSGRDAVLSVAIENGLDRVAAARIRDDLADPVALEDFLRQLLGGLRRDLRSVELDEISVDAESASLESEVARVALVAPSRIPGTGPWPAGTVVLSLDSGRWRVDRLEPRLVMP